MNHADCPALPEVNSAYRAGPRAARTGDVVNPPKHHTPSCYRQRIVHDFLHNGPPGPAGTVRGEAGMAEPGFPGDPTVQTPAQDSSLRAGEEPSRGGGGVRGGAHRVWRGVDGERRRQALASHSPRQDIRGVSEGPPFQIDHFLERVSFSFVRVTCQQAQLQRNRKSDLRPQQPSASTCRVLGA